MKKVLILLVLLLMLPFSVRAEEKVKVYVFEAGGCPYCEAEKEYLKTFGDKIEVISYELYVDHVDWEPGKDYKLGVDVADAFNDAGFEDASYYSTPFVVISDLYAASGYNTELEKYIEAAIEEGDMDAVECIASGETGCVRDHEDSKVSKDSKAAPGVTKGSKTSAIISVSVIVVLLAGVLFVTRKQK